jgi:hypothetical protein
MERGLRGCRGCPRIELSGVHQKGFCLILVKNQISKERSSPMKEGKYQKQKPQIRVNPRNPRSIRLDEYYFLNPDNC